MGEFSSVEEILRFAIVREQEAYQIYKEFAELTRNPGMRNLFEEFALDEQEHKALLELELTKRGMVVKDIDIGDYTVEGELRAGMNYKDALLIAMDKEKASFRLYFDLARRAKDPEQQEAFMSLAEQEARHKVMFEIEYETLQAREKQDK